jgi:hypothetical protein
MDDREQLVAALRLEIERLKSTPSVTTEEGKRHELHRCINTCIRESLALLASRLQTDWTGHTPQPEPERARYVGQQ